MNSTVGPLAKVIMAHYGSLGSREGSHESLHTIPRLQSLALNEWGTRSNDAPLLKRFG